MSTKNWLIFKEIAGNPAVQALFDRAVAQIAGGTPPPLNRDYPVGFMVEGQKLLGSAVLEYRLSQEALAHFSRTDLRDFVEQMRALLGWNEIDHTLHRWVHAWLRDPYFVNQGHNWSAHWVRKSDAPAADLPDSVYRFACDIALGDLKYGPSYARVSAEEIFDWVTQLGSELPAQLKQQGTGELPPALARWQGDGASATANDALAVVRITQRAASEAAYGQVLDYLVQLLSTTDFSRSYAIEYRGICPFRACPGKACTSCLRRPPPTRGCMNGSRPMHMPPCASTTGTRTWRTRTVPCQAALRCSRWPGPTRGLRRWSCSTCTPWMVSTNRCRAGLSRPMPTPTAWTPPAWHI
jgi:hypothetical protein